MATRFTAWKAEDDSIHETEELALKHEARARFFKWFEENISFTNSPRTVARIILDEWTVERKCRAEPAEPTNQP